MSRAVQINENIKRQTGKMVYRCMNNQCQHVEMSDSLRPKDAMQGLGASCSKCGGVTEAVWGGTTLPGHIAQPISHKVARG